MHLMATPAGSSTPSSEQTGIYSVGDVSRLFEIPEHRLRYWSQTGFLLPSVRRGDRRFYNFRDLIAIKVAKGLLDDGLPLRRVRRQLEALRTTLPRVEAPLHDLRIRCEHDRVVVDHAAHCFEAGTGQLVLDFEVSVLHEQAAQILALPWVDDDPPPSPPRTAYEWFLFAQTLEDQGDGPADPEGLMRVRHAYEAALELDPRLAAAWTNLGGLLAELGELEQAQDYFEEAIRHDPDQVQARLNLAELALRGESPDEAIEAYRGVLRLEPDHFEAHYGLARALLRQGTKGEALAHLERFRSAVDRLPSGEQVPELMVRRQRVHSVIDILRTALGR